MYTLVYTYIYHAVYLLRSRYFSESNLESHTTHIPPDRIAVQCDLENFRSWPTPCGRFANPISSFDFAIAALIVRGYIAVTSNFRNRLEEKRAVTCNEYESIK